MAWNPFGSNRPWNKAAVTDLATQAPFPASGVAQSQGNPYSDEIADELQIPQGMGLNLQGFVNPYSLTFYSYPLSTTVPTRVAPPNQKRAYLIVQNQGPGNIWLNFGQDVYAATATTNSNGMQLIQTQFYEEIGGGDVDPAGNSRAYAFVSPDYISAITDTAGTTLLVGEGVWRFVNPPDYLIR